jgi:hypothetical protein
VGEWRQEEWAWELEWREARQVDAWRKTRRIRTVRVTMKRKTTMRKMRTKTRKRKKRRMRRLRREEFQREALVSGKQARSGEGETTQYSDPQQPQAAEGWTSLKIEK